MVTEVPCRTALSRSRIYGVNFSLNPYFGCEHSCVYCYVPRMMPLRLKGRAWGSFVDVKVDIPKVLIRELRRIASGRILLSSITDPYQPVERLYGLTRKCIELLAKREFEIVVLTKSSLFTRDLELMGIENFEIGVTITTLRYHEELEPKAHNPLERLEALKKASERGFKTFLFLGPLLPGVVDEEIQEILELARESGVHYVIVDKLNTRGDVVQAIMKALNGDRLNSFFKAISDRDWLKNIRGKIVGLCKRLGIPCDFCF